MLKSSTPFYPTPGGLTPRQSSSSSSSSSVAFDAPNQWLFSADQISHCPSFRDGMTHAQIEEKRQRGCDFIRGVGAELRL